ncbi:MAG: glycoside hydrolase family 15 protein [bacterium]|nr:glycoside hydrolase family 15 protein [bacterium]MDZ4285827.1 glycoside hydrolase family 15 protein [Candidatus Sungbacteria bacterium]
MKGKIYFPKQQILATMESLRRPNGAFIASVSPAYRAMWLRDHLYITYTYWYIGDFKKLLQGVWLVFDFLKGMNEHEGKGQKRKMMRRIASPSDIPGGIIHTKCDADTLAEITTDDGWGHHQLCWIGLFLHIVADLDFKNVRVIRDSEDIDVMQLLVFYLRSVEYWHKPDYGMWEECKIRHASSIGAVTDGLSYVRRRRLTEIDVPESLIQCGEQALRDILPWESRDICGREHHRHCCDAAQLTLLWPYSVIVNPAHADQVLNQVVHGHPAQKGEIHKLVQTHGLNRYWGDDYYRSTEGRYVGISAEWSMFEFWISIIYSQRHNNAEAMDWFGRGCRHIVNSAIPEAYKNGKPNDQTPLAWAHAIALIAFQKLTSDQHKEIALQE